MLIIKALCKVAQAPAHTTLLCNRPDPVGAIKLAVFFLLQGSFDHVRCAFLVFDALPCMKVGRVCVCIQKRMGLDLCKKAVEFSAFKAEMFASAVFSFIRPCLHSRSDSPEK